MFTVLIPLHCSGWPENSFLCPFLPISKTDHRQLRTARRSDVGTRINDNLLYKLNPFIGYLYLILFIEPADGLLKHLFTDLKLTLDLFRGALVIKR